MSKNKVIQIRLSDSEFNFIKLKLEGQNISEMLRIFLLEEAKKCSTEEEKKVIEMEKIKQLLEKEDVLLFIYNKLKEII